jgi:hypothetical protein
MSQKDRRMNIGGPERKRKKGNKNREGVLGY